MEEHIYAWARREHAWLLRAEGLTFRAIGHYLSWRGARRGLRDVAWRSEPSAPLTDVRRAIVLPSSDRRDRLEAISQALGLKHFTGFVERVASRTT